ncbi:MAG: hypothetical protein PHE88_03935 [Elusimicrobia bacterium]|nr:hypothetical protein [Elusimicrobiota bacterium]
MEPKNMEFIKKYYSDSKIKGLILNQAKNYDYCIGSGQVLVERGWTFPVKEIEISKIEELMNDSLDLFFPIRCKDDKYLYVIWDVEYFNTENPAYIFDKGNQRKVFKLMESSLNNVEQILDSFGIKYLIDVTMSGIHVWSKISIESEAFEKLAKEGMVLPSLAQKYSQVVPSDRKRVKPVSAELGKAYNALGKVLEYFTHNIIKKNKKGIPVTISDAPSSSKLYPSAGISSDLTQYAHPIYMRCIRALCSIHQKSLMNGHSQLGPAIDIVKLKNMSYSDALDIMWDVDKAIGFYKKNFNKKKLEVPESSSGWLEAVDSYLKSDLRKQHKKWEKAKISAEIPDYNQPDIKNIFDSANPALLNPANLQKIANYFNKNGGLKATKKIFSVIANNYYKNNSLNWYDPVHFTGINWEKYDAETVADFWGRAYWSLNTADL